MKRSFLIFIFFVFSGATTLYASPVDDIQNIWIRFSRVDAFFIPAGSSNIQQQTVNQQSRTIDLLKLQRGFLKNTGMETLPGGLVHTLFLYVDEAWLVKKNGEVVSVEIPRIEGIPILKLEGTLPVDEAGILVIDWDRGNGLTWNSSQGYTLKSNIPVYTLAQALAGQIPEGNEKIQFVSLEMDHPKFSPGNMDTRKDAQSVDWFHHIRTTDELSSQGTSETESFSIEWSVDYSSKVSGNIVKSFEETFFVPRPPTSTEVLTFPMEITFSGKGFAGEDLPEGYYILVTNNVFHKSPGLGPNGQATNPSKTLDYDREFREILIDNTPPEVVDLFPVSGEIVPYNPLGVSAVFTDNLAGLDVEASKDVFVDDTLAIPITEEGFSQEVDLEEGYHTLDFYLLDNAGNLNEFESHFTVDALPPEIAFQIPGTFSTLTPTLLATYRDAGTVVVPETVTVSIDGVSYTSQAEISASLLRLEVEGPLTEGIHTIVVTAADASSHVGTLSQDFAVFEPRDPATETAEKQIGFGGGVLEVNDPFSNLDQIRVEVPPGTIGGSVTVREIPVPPVPTTRPNWISMGPIFELGPNNVTFNQPVIVTIPLFQNHLEYMRNVLPKEGIRIVTSKDEGNTYQVLPQEAILNVDYEMGTVTFKTNSFSFFGAVFGGFVDFFGSIVEFASDMVDVLVDLVRLDFKQAFRDFIGGLLEAADSFGLLSPYLPEANPELSFCAHTTSQDGGPTADTTDDPITQGDPSKCPVDTLEGKNCAITLGGEGPATTLFARGIDKFKMNARFIKNANGAKLVTSGSKVLTIHQAMIVEEHEEPYAGRDLLGFIPLPFASANGPWGNIHIQMLAYRNRSDVSGANCAQFFPRTSTNGSLGPFAFNERVPSVVSPAVQVFGFYPNRTTSPDIQELSAFFPNSSLLDFARHCEPILDINHDGAVNGSDSDILLQGPYRPDNPNQCEWVSAETWGFQHIRYSNYGLIDLERNSDIAGVVFELYESDEGFYNDALGGFSLNGEDVLDPNFEATVLLKDRIGINNTLILKTRSLPEEEPPPHEF